MNRIAVRANICVTILFLWCSGLSPAQPLFDQPQNPLAGSRVFGSKGCSKCHALNGIGGQIGPDLARLPGARSYYDLGAAMWNHLPGMKEQMRELGITRPLLTPQETADLVAFLFIFNYFDPPGNAQEGRELFGDKKCVVCHQIGGVGGTVGPNLDVLGEYGTPIYLAAAMWNHGPAMAATMRDKGIRRPTFSRAEFLDLIAYLKSASQEPRDTSLNVMAGSKEEGQRLFVRKGCVECHRVQGQGGRVGPELTGLGLRGGLIELAVMMWNKAPKMMRAMEETRVSFPQLEAREMADIVAYLYSVEYFAAKGNSGRGRSLIESKGCLTCHSLYGRGARTAVDLGNVEKLDSLASVISAMWNHSLVATQNSLQRSLWPRFLSQETADIAAFLQEVGRSR